MPLRRIIGIVLVAGGVVLLILGIQATDSFSSQFSKFFTGSPTDRAIWLMIGGVAALIAGSIIAGLPGRTGVR